MVDWDNHVYDDETKTTVPGGVTLVVDDEYID